MGRLPGWEVPPVRATQGRIPRGWCATPGVPLGSDESCWAAPGWAPAQHENDLKRNGEKQDMKLCAAPSRLLVPITQRKTVVVIGRRRVPGSSRRTGRVARRVCKTIEVTGRVLVAAARRVAVVHVEGRLPACIRSRVVSHSRAPAGCVRRAVRRLMARDAQTIDDTHHSGMKGSPRPLEAILVFRRECQALRSRSRRLSLL